MTGLIEAEKASMTGLIEAEKASMTGLIEAEKAEFVFDGAFCPYFHRAVELIGRRWTGAIVRAMLCGVGRFGELTEAIPDLSDRMLSERLKELEAAGIVARTVIPSTPVRIEYRLTPKGLALAPILEAISVWAGDWSEAE